MNIAFLLPEFPRLDQTYIESQLRGLLDRGHDVTVYAPRPPDGAIDAVAAARFASRVREQPRLPAARAARTVSGLRLAARHGCRHPRLVARALNPLRFGRYAPSFAALHAAVGLLDRPSFDVAHCHFGPAGVFGAILQELGVLRAPLVVTFYGHDVTRYPRERGEGVYRRLFARAGLVLALDPLMQRRLEALGAAPARLAIHPLGVDCRRFAPAAEPPPPPLRLLSVGRFVEKKGFGDALRAMAILRGQGCDARYRIAGSGPLAPALERAAKELGLEDAVEFLGHVAHEDVTRLMRSSHALVAPSVRAADGDEEGTPTVIIEAMACGLPVIATRHAGIPYLVEDGVTGWLVDEGDVAALADRLGRLADRSASAHVGAAGRAAAERRFECAALAGLLETRYEAVAAARRECAT